MNGKLSKKTFVLMLMVALFADLLSFVISWVPLVGQFLNPAISFFFAMSLWLWLAFNGLGFKGALGSGAGMVIETIPFLQMLPPFTAMVVIIYLRQKAKEKVVGKVVGTITPKVGGTTSTLRKAA